MINVKMKEVLIIGAVFILKVSGQCTFPSPWASSTWLDNTRGTITFGTTTMTGWSITVFNQQISSWECVDSSSSTTLVMRSTQSVTYSTTTFYAFLCMKLTQLSTNSYSYILQQAKQQNAGYERLWFSPDSTLSTVSTICDSSASIPTLEFHVLVKQGMGDSAAITFPDNFLFSADYKYMASDGTVACNNTSDTMDMCTDTKALSFNNYTNCKQEIAYSAGGELWCVATASLSSYDCAVVFNRDATISGTASQFACLCSNGSSVSVVSGNCTSDQTPSSYPTAADGTTVIGYRLTIESVYVNCAPTTTTTTTTTGSSGLNGGVIAAVVISIILIIVIIFVSICLYKHGYCVIICYQLKRCLERTCCCEKIPCWTTCRNKVCVCCKNKVDGAEAEKPMLTNGVGPHVETINETSRRPRLQKDKTSMSAITRSSSMAVTREKSELETSLQRQTTATSIGLELKSERPSSLHQIKVKSQNEEDEKEPRLKVLGRNLSRLVCCPEKKDDVKTVTVVEPTEKPSSPLKEKPAKGAVKKGAKVKGGKGKGKGGKGKGKGGKDGGKDEKNEGKAEEKGVTAEEKGDKTERKGGESKEEKGEDTGEKGEGIAKGKGGEKGGKTGGKKGKKEKKSKDLPDDTARSDDVTLTEVANIELTRAPTKMQSDLRLTSTPIPGSAKGQKGVVSVPAGLLKPQDKSTEWTFLSCCFGNRSPPPAEEEKVEVPAAPVPSKKKVGAKTAAKGKGGGKKDGGGPKKTGKKGGGGKGGGKKKDANENDLIEEDLTDEQPALDRAKTMPEREKTALNLQDAEKVKVAVYIPTDKTNLQLKDTVINGQPKLEKSKTDVGVVRPPSSRPASSVKQKGGKGKSEKKGNKKANKGKEAGTKSSKDKKGSKKKKK